VGWAAVTGTLDVSALCLFLIVFYWTPPHFWALALLKQVDYGRAKVPMAPLVWGERETMYQMVWYTVILIVLTLLPVLFGAFGTLYLVSAIVLNALLMGGVLKVLFAARASKPWTGPAWWVYKYSLLYLALLFLAMAVDRAIAP
jgi:protoheme IX farnesyltransferase